MRHDQDTNSSSASEEEDYQEVFEKSESGASITVPKVANTLKKGHYVNVNGRPCKITEITFSKNGKHGHSKANYEATDIFTGKHYEDVCPSSRIVQSPIVSINVYTLMDISSDGYMSLMSDQHEMKEDLKLPEEEEGRKLKKMFEESSESINVTVINAMGLEAVTSFKEL